VTTLLLVGGTAGIGLEVCRRYAGEGWSVVLTGRDQGRAEAVASDLAGEVAGDVRGLALDLAEPEAVGDALAGVGPVDHLVLSAIARDANSVAHYDIAGARHLATMKLVGYPAVVSAVLDRLAPDGSVVLFGGRAKDRPYPGSTTVSTVNGGVSGLVRTLALELAPRRVNALHPGIVADSPFWSGKTEATDRVRDHTPTGRNVTTADIVDAVDFLVRNRSVNGIDLYVDGGWLLQ
jgi:NAD(P)-dependent dehydrogenase (short-subunit alcohol dehydrogenase family)